MIPQPKEAAISYFDRAGGVIIDGPGWYHEIEPHPCETMLIERAKRVAGRLGRQLDWTQCNVVAKKPGKAPLEVQDCPHTARRIIYVMSPPEVQEPQYVGLLVNPVAVSLLKQFRGIQRTIVARIAVRHFSGAHN